MSALWMSAMIDAAARATVLLGVAAAVTLVLRHRSAAMRHLVWSVALAGALILPAAGVVMPALRVPVPDVVADALYRADPRSEAPAPDVTTTPLPPGDREIREPERELALDPATVARAESPPFRAASAPAAAGAFAWVEGVSRPAGLLFMWLIGVALLATRSLLGVWSARRLARRSDEMTAAEWRALLQDICTELGVHRPVRLLRSPRASIPMTWGWRRPVVLVPEEAEQWSLERRVVVLRHELAHVKRGDYVTQLVGQWAAALYWFNPLVLIAARRQRVERERACDDEVLRLGTRASTYATHLLEIARSVQGPVLSASAAIAMARRSQLEGRLMAILDPQVRRVATRAAATVIVVMLTTLALAVSVVTPDAKTAGMTDDAVRLGTDVRLDEEPVSPAVVAETQTDQTRAAGRRQAIEAERERLAQDAARTGAEIEREVRARLEATRLQRVEIDGVAIDVETMAREAEAIGREMAERFERFELVQENEDERPLDPRLVEAFIGALTDTDAEVRERAAFALGRNRVAQAVTPLVRALDDADAEVREQAANALGRGSRTQPPSMAWWVRWTMQNPTWPSKRRMPWAISGTSAPSVPSRAP